VVAWSLLGELGTTRETSDLRARILRLQEKDAIADLEELLREHPGSEEVAAALRSEREELAARLLDQPDESRFDEVLRQLELAGRAGSFWHVMMLFETNRLDEARALLREEKLPTYRARLAQARLNLLERKFAEARDALEEPPPEDADAAAAVHHYLLLSRAQRAVKDDAWQESVEKARAASGGITQKWLQERVDDAMGLVVEARRGTQGLEIIRNLYRNVQDFSDAALRNLARIGEDLSTVERRSVEAYIESVLRLAGEESRIATELIRRGEERVRQAADDRERVLGYLLQSIGMLALGDAGRARDALQAAVNIEVPALDPYVYWAYSLAARAEGEIGQALREAGEAIDFARLVPFPPEDLLRLGRHTQLLLQQVPEEERREFVERVYERLPAILREPLERFISPPAANGESRD